MTATDTKPLTGPELVAEVRYLLDAGVHPLLIAQELHRSPASIEVAARRAGDTVMAARFTAAMTVEHYAAERRRRQAVAA